MAQHDYVIANGSGAAVRSDLNNALAAIVSQNSGATEPTTTYAYQWWADTTTGLLKLRNAANNAWITLRELDGTLTVEDGTAAAPGLAFTSDLNTGIFRAGADQFNIATNGVERVEFGTSEVVFNDGGANYDFRIEGDTNANLFFVDASAEAVGIGTTTPGAALHILAQDGTIYQQATRGTGTTWRLQTSGANGQSYELYDITNSQRAYLYTGGTGGSWQFSTEGAERARIDSSGRLLVGTSTSSQYTSTTSSIQLTSSDSAQDPRIQLRANATTDSASIDFGGGAQRNGVIQGEARSLVFYTNSSAGTGNVTQRMSIDSSGYLRLESAGIQFNGDTADANALNDYEEGTYTVNFYDAVTGGNTSSTTATGYYTVIGNLATITFSASNINTAGLTGGNVLYFSLPFTSRNGPQQRGSVSADTVTFTSGYLNSVVNTNAARGSLLRTTTGAIDANITVSSLSSGSSDLVVTITYQLPV